VFVASLPLEPTHHVKKTEWERKFAIQWKLSENRKKRKELKET